MNLAAGPFESMQSWNFTVVTSNSTLWREEPRVDEKGTLTLRTNNAVADGVEVQVTMTDNGGTSRNGIQSLTRNFTWSLRQAVGATVARITPRSGATDGNYLVELQGLDFDLTLPAYPDKKMVAKIGDVLCLDTVVESKTRAQCQVPPGQGADLNVFVGFPDADVWATNMAVRFSYFKPVLERLDPTQVPASAGGLVTLVGQNFGVFNTTKLVSLAILQSDGRPIDNHPLVLEGTSESSSSHTRISFRVPPTKGSYPTVCVTVGEQQSCQTEVQTWLALTSLSAIRPKMDLHLFEPRAAAWCRCLSSSMRDSRPSPKRPPFD